MFQWLIFGFYWSQKHLQPITGPPFRNVLRRIRFDDQMRVSERLLSIVFVDGHSHAEDVGSSIRYGQRVGNYLGELRKINDQIGEVDDNLLQLLKISRRFRPEALEERVCLCFLDQHSCQRLVEGWKRNGDLAKKLGC